ncbi:MAG: HD domain-containing protein [Candidatus Lokiarchaeota archaeon]
MSENSNIIKEVYIYAQKRSEKDDIHGFAHVLRVYKLCMKLAEHFKVNYKILKISALLHDIEN